MIEGKGGKTPIGVVVADHDTRLREEELLPGLAAHGFEVVGVGSAAALYRSLVGDRYDLVVLGADLPDESGLAVARHLRRHSSLGIAMLLELHPPRGHAEALQAGVDLCFAKPVETETLALSLHNLAARLGGTPARSRGELDWSLKADGWQLASPGQRALALSMPERIILKRLFATHHAPVPRAALLADLLATLDEFDPTSLERLVHRLRRRVLQRTGLPLPLEVIRGTGYMLVLDEAQ
ncbi:response regulator transcription factor [Dyella sp. 2RAB6]|uniref:response regulator transcription factor n=1 Tax=Dyella sp. 2RAB6 TaxID=3232992 RepID=UPI003F8DF949